MIYPETLSDLEKELLNHAQDGRSDAGFRLAIAVSQIGSLAMHFTHDQKENPVARPYGSRQGEVSDAGHAMVQLMTYCALRGISLQEAVNAALDNLRDKDFIARVETSGEIEGDTTFEGDIVGMAFLDPYCENLTSMPRNSILVAKHPKTSSTPTLRYCRGIVTDHGGITSNAAIVGREYGIPCIVGTASATSKIKDRQIIRIIGNGRRGTVKIC